MLRDFSRDLESIELCDFRLSERVRSIFPRLFVHPSSSLPKIFAKRSELDGFYRFVNNPRIMSGSILEPHIRRTLDHVKARGVALVIHDTTDIAFSHTGTRVGLGLVTTGQQGFFAHVSLAVELETGGPLGVLGLRTFLRDGPGKGRRSQFQRRKDGDSEFRRWFEQALKCEEGVESEASLIHLMDCEADAYELIALMEGKRYVVRSKYDRNLADNQGKLSELGDLGKPFCEREIWVSSRKAELPNSVKSHPDRKRRLARLEFHARTVVIPRTQQTDPSLPPKLRINVVYVRELNCPSDQEPICWTLLTSEPIATLSEVIKVVDFYKTRWVIEEYFKVLKTGCNYEKKQLESHDTLIKTFELFLPVACQVLSLRGLAEKYPEKASKDLLNEIQIKILSAVTKTPIEKLSRLADAMRAIAQMGGHVHRHTRPGWLVLWRGFEELTTLENGWRIAICDGR